MSELWVWIGDFPNYQVSNTGKIKKYNGVTIKQCLNHKGYPCVNLTNAQGRSTRTVHRLVAENFIENPEKKKTVNHKDGIKTNNCVNNLEWMTNAENQAHAAKLGLKPSGESNKLSKLSEMQVLTIRTMTNMRPHDIARHFDICTANIVAIRHSKTWRHLPKTPKILKGHEFDFRKGKFSQ